MNAARAPQGSQERPSCSSADLPHWPLDTLIPYARNARTHSAEQISQLVASIKAFGFTIPVLVDESGELIAGHGRVLAARELGLESVPVLVARGWTDEQKRAYVIADNKLALNAGWDFELLSVELDELRDANFDLDLLGFEPAELNDLIGTPNAPFKQFDESAADEVEFLECPHCHEKFPK